MTPELALCDRAFQLAEIAHRGQVDKAGNDYFTAHVLDVAARVGDDPMARMVAYLHDVVEDTVWTLETLAHVGFPGEVLVAVRDLTHRPNEPRLDYYARVKANPLALRVKLADIASNTDTARLSLLEPKQRARLLDKYYTALQALQ